LSDGLELLEESERLVPDRLLDQCQLTQRGATEDGLQANARNRDATLATGSLQGGAQLVS
jgi:hypothetical protein